MPSAVSAHAMRRLTRRHPQRGDAKDQKQDVEEGVTDLRRGQHKAELDRDVAADLKNREIVVFEAVVEVGFRQDNEDADQGDAGQKESRRDHHRDGAGGGVDHEHGGADRIACHLHRKRMPSMRSAALQDVERQLAGKSDRAARALTLKQ